MKQKDKELLIRYLCMALPYKIVIDYSYNAFEMRKGNYASCIKQGSKSLLDCDLLDVFISPRQNEKGEYIKPYLRSMSSMTEEEMKRFTDTHSLLDANGIRNNVCCTVEGMDYLNSIHVDYRGLISMGLALEAPEDMYKIE